MILALCSYAISAISRVAVSLIPKATIAGLYVINSILLTAAIAYRAAIVLSYTISVLSHLFFILASCALNAASFTVMLVFVFVTFVFSLLASLVPYAVDLASFVITSAFGVIKTLESNPFVLIPHVIKATVFLLS